VVTARHHAHAFVERGTVSRLAEAEYRLTRAPPSRIAAPLPAVELLLHERWPINPRDGIDRRRPGSILAGYRFSPRQPFPGA